MIKLGVNIDHVATIRQARGTTYPDIVAAALAAERGGADGITIHLREDRRHIQDADLHALMTAVATKVNLEMAATDEMVAIAAAVQPADVCVVPERRAELTTEGGLDVVGALDLMRRVVSRLRAAGIRVSLFIDADAQQIQAAHDVGADAIELHTGRYADAPVGPGRNDECDRIAAGAKMAAGAGLIVNAGHGLTLDNVQPIAVLPEIHELNIGHSIVARAIFVGLEEACREMKTRMLAARAQGG
jgi:pyridoxine 5-phosphate synthase